MRIELGKYRNSKAKGKEAQDNADLDDDDGHDDEDTIENNDD
jgi:hypothetical protein